MLIRFVVENFLSFKDEVEFSMLAGESDEHTDHVHKVRDMRILKTGVIFGANASGKTNLIKAMSFAQNFITSGSLKTEYLKLTPFLLDSESAAEPSEFLFEIQCGIGQCFQYYFSVDPQRVHKESLHEIHPKGARMMFERETDSRGHTNVEIGKVNVLVTNDDDPFDFIRDFRPNELFMTAVNTEGNTEFSEDVDPSGGMDENPPESDSRLFVRHTFGTTFSPVTSLASPNRPEPRIAFLDTIFDWFDRTLVPVFSDSLPTQGIGFGIMKDSDLEHRLKEILEFLDLGIDGVHLHQIEGDVEKDLPEEYKRFANEFIKDIPADSDERAIFGQYGSERYLTVDAAENFSVYELVTLHRVGDENRYIAFNLESESDGTRRLLQLMPALLGLHNNTSDHVFVIDELDSSIHAHLTGKVIELFLKSAGNRANQLVVTSHDTGLLDLDLLRRDEIWFIEKDRNGASSLYSLEEFRLPENMNIEKGYLFGRFGAIPVSPSLDSLEWLRET